MLSTVRRGSSNRSLMMMFLNPLPDINRAPGLPEVLGASSVDGCGAPASRKAFNTRSLRSKQLATGGRHLPLPSAGAVSVASTCSPPTALDLMCWGLGGGESGSVVSSFRGGSCVLSASGCPTGGSGAGVAEIGSGSSKPKADKILTKQSQIYHQTSRMNKRYIMNKELHS
jgi:hypothetical protein